MASAGLSGLSQESTCRPSQCGCVHIVVSQTDRIVLDITASAWNIRLSQCGNTVTVTFVSESLLLSSVFSWFQLFSTAPRPTVQELQLSPGKDISWHHVQLCGVCLVVVSARSCFMRNRRPLPPSNLPIPRLPFPFPAFLLAAGISCNWISQKAVGCLLFSRSCNISPLGRATVRCAAPPPISTSRMWLRTHSNTPYCPAAREHTPSAGTEETVKIFLSPLFSTFFKKEALSVFSTGSVSVHACLRMWICLWIFLWMSLDLTFTNN